MSRCVSAFGCLCLHLHYRVHWDRLRLANSVINQVATTVRFIHIVQWWDSLRLAPTSIGGQTEEGVVGGGFSISTGWSHRLSASQEEENSFMKFTHSHRRMLTHVHTNTHLQHASPKGMQRRQLCQWGNIQVRSLQDVKLPPSFLKTLYRLSVFLPCSIWPFLHSSNKHSDREQMHY